MQWDVKIDELIPQTMRTAEVPDNPAPKARSVAKPGTRLEDFRDDD